MRLASHAFEDGALIPADYTCDGENINPPLEIFGVPENAQSLVLIMDDPDAPGGEFVHWTLWNIDPETVEIPEGFVPEEAAQGLTSFGEAGYGGPCPPSGIHRYFFKLYALDAKLNLEASADKTELEAAMNHHVIDHAELLGRYGRDEV